MIHGRVFKEGKGGLTASCIKNRTANRSRWGVPKPDARGGHVTNYRSAQEGERQRLRPKKTVGMMNRLQM